jgi:hypothetical protein
MLNAARIRFGRIANSMTASWRAALTRFAGIAGSVTACLRAALARFKHIARPMSAWWRAAQSDPQARTNLRFLLASLILTLSTIPAFLWFAGILDWRGSDGITKLSFVLQCSDKASDQTQCKQGLELADAISANLDLRNQLQPAFNPPRREPDELYLNLGYKQVINDSLASVLAPHTDLLIISNRVYGFLPKGTNAVYRTQMGWASAHVQPPLPITLTFPGKTLMRHTGLSEREFSISLAFDFGAYSHKKWKLDFTVCSPETFHIVETSPPAQPDSSGQCSAMHLTNEMPYFRVWTRMRDFEAARIDHILDSSIYTLLGVAAGGVVTACLALALLRRDRDLEC